MLWPYNSISENVLQENVLRNQANPSLNFVPNLVKTCRDRLGKPISEAGKDKMLATPRECIH